MPAITFPTADYMAYYIAQGDFSFNLAHKLGAVHITYRVQSKRTVLSNKY